MSDESSIEPKGFRLVTLGDGNVWYANRPFSYNDMHWISPADERGHEYFLKILIENGFLSVVNIIGNEHGLTHILKALIGRNLFDDEAYYPILNEDDKCIRKAIETLSKKTPSS